MNQFENMLFVERYRPKKIQECILPVELKKTFQSIVDSKNMQNLLLCGKSGCGKTTVARALCSEMNCDTIFINASESGNIDTLRTTIRNFASTVSLTGNKKVVILDEADHITAATQPALRGFIEEFSANCRFILTCNYKNRIIEPLHSRFSVIEFNIPVKEKAELAGEFYKKCCIILAENSIEYDDKVLAELIRKYFPDFRRILGELQRYGASGKIDVGILTKLSDLSIKSLIEAMKSKNYTDVRKWIGQNSDIDSNLVFRKIFDSMNDYVEKPSIPNLIMILGDYQYKIAFSADHEICLSACMAEIMLNIKFK